MLRHGLLAVLLQTPVPVTPRDAFRLALAAVEGDSVARVERAWSRQDSPVAALGLGAMAQLTYRFARADALYRSVPVRWPRADATTRTWAGLGLAMSAHQRADFVLADSLYRAAAEQARAQGDRDTELEILLGWPSVRMRRPGEPGALSLLERADSLTPPGDAEMRYRRVCALAQVRFALGRPAPIRASYDAADSAARAGNRRQAARCLYIAASILAQQGYHDSATAWLGRAAAWQRAVHDRSGLTASLQWAGYSYANTGRYAEARPILEESIREGHASGNLSPVVWSHFVLAGLELGIGDLAEAAREAHLTDSLGRVVGDQGAQLAARGIELQQALLFAPAPAGWAAVTRLREVADRLPGGFLVQVWRSSAELSARERKWAAAETALDSAARAANQFRLTGSLIAIEDDRARQALLRGDAARGAQLLDSVIAVTGANQTGFRMETRTARALAAVRLGRVREATAMLRIVMDSLELWRAGLGARELQRAVFDLRDPMARGSPLGQAIAELALAGAVEPAFELAERCRAKLLLDRLVLADASARNGAKLSRAAGKGAAVVAGPGTVSAPNLAVVEYLLPAEGPGIAFVVTQGTVVAVPIGGADSVGAMIRRHRVLIEAGDAAPGVGRTLAARVLDPVLKQLPERVDRLVIIADGPIHALALDALPMPDGRPLVTRFAISAAPSLTVAARLWSSTDRTSAGEFLAIGDPDFGAGRPDSSTAFWRATFAGSGGLPRLPASADEARALAELGSTTIRLRRDASESFLARSDLTRFRIVHLATHALVDGQTVARTALALVPGEGEDGFVTVAELSRWKLDADLLTLSACRTGQGVPAGGEGLQGLVSAAMEAGARAVLATNWKVRDKAAAEFIGQFYGAVASGLSLDQALAVTKRRWIAAARPARDWAAFTLSGNGLAVIAAR